MLIKHLKKTSVYHRKKYQEATEQLKASQGCVFDLTASLILTKLMTREVTLLRQRVAELERQNQELQRRNNYREPPPPQNYHREEPSNFGFAGGQDSFFRTSEPVSELLRPTRFDFL
jgi:hypothetical protein